eukprot:CAMPEP_0117069636 /NCGR_PEP_ID=MMETSP0472-20121206/48861_1 /TAXON_ID=693140 ORGANISM="Tiarina fusus, Strain LIS" /NCGR_SAMPLE_ID=MMETSP0472 /ASSEMBLY_ACC=CAM_ASM_000603 /LENGTH=625 /DNA_ID=CAMNT_0004792293 /DNA_START=230 /DNA_END=2108 /DNA_ORIENTATION=+
MTARDYQHKRFRSRGADSKNKERGSTNTLDSEPRVVTPQSTASGRPLSSAGSSKSFQPPPRLDDPDTDPSNGYVAPFAPHAAEEEESDPLKKIMSDSYRSPGPSCLDIPLDLPPSESPYVHKPTASNGGLTQESPLKITEPMRYSLTKGAQTPDQQQKAIFNRRASDQGGVYPKAIFNRRASDQGGVYPPSSSERKGKEGSSRRASEPFGRRSSGSRIRKQDPNAYKIFILLLQPESKIFELIQLIYNPNDTSVGNILTMIPENATEAALGSQDYVGLCRPKTQEELLEKDILASEARPGLVSAKITLGEILVAIPKGFTGQDVSTLSKQILANPKIVKLLKRADPLAPKKKRSSRSGRHRRGSRSSSRENVHVLEKLGEEAEDEAHAGMTDDDERRMKAAMQNSLASVSNHEDDSMISESTGGSSLDESYSSWSKSFDASFSVQSSVCSGVSKRAARRRDRQARRLRILKQSALGAYVIMIAFYLIDTRGKGNDDAHAQNDVVRQNPMGLMGVFQCLFLLLTLYKVERLVRSATSNNSNSNDGKNGYNNNNGNNETEHRCPFLRASNTAMKRLKAKYAKKLKRAKKTTVDEREETSVVSKRLKNFSLRQAIATGASVDEDDNTR